MSNWWEHALIYQIYPRSFFDSNGDGCGDIKGISCKLDYIRSIGVDAIWLSPVFCSPMKDFGYDVSDYREVDPIFGTTEDVKELINATHEKRMKFLLDLVPNHTSDLHPWFQASRQSKTGPFADYYVWHDGIICPETGERVAPNNWKSCFGGSAWTWVEERQQFYYHQFLKEQPDLNFYNKNVKNEIQEVMKFWFDLGVDGFRVDAVRHLTYSRNKILENEPVKLKKEDSKKTCEQDYDHYEHTLTVNQPETFVICREWDNFVAIYNNGKENKRYLIYEIWKDEEEELDLTRYYGQFSAPFNFTLTFLTDTDIVNDLRQRISDWLDIIPANRKTFWTLGNHDKPRVTTRCGEKAALLLNLIAQTLPGAMVTYQGEELGAKDVPVTYEQCVDPFGKKHGKENYAKFGRDPQRSPMCWTKAKNAGFTTADTPWLAVDADYERICVEVDGDFGGNAQDGCDSSFLEAYKRGAMFRKKLATLQFEFVDDAIGKDVFAFRRFSDNECYTVICNFSSESVEFQAEWGQKVLSTEGTKGTAKKTLKPFEGAVYLK